MQERFSSVEEEMMMLSCKPIPIRTIDVSPSVEELDSSTESFTESFSPTSEAELEETTLSVNQELMRLENEKHAFDELKANWLEEVTQLRESAQQEGYETGYAEGLNKGSKEGYEAGFEQINHEMINYVQSIKQEGLRVKEEIAQQLIDVQPFLLEIIEKSVESIIYERLEQGGNRHLKMIEKALSHVSKHQFVTLQVSREQYDWVKEQRNELELLCPQAVFQILINPQLEMFDVLVETEQTELDFRLNLQLENWKEDLKRMVSE